MKRMIAIIVAILTAALLFSGCAGGKEKRIGEIIDFPDELPVSLIAYSDDPSAGSKETTDAEMIKKVVEFYKNRSYVSADTPAPGSNAAVEFKYADGSLLTLSANAIKSKDGKTYAPKTLADGLGALIEQIVSEKAD